MKKKQKKNKKKVSINKKKQEKHVNISNLPNETLIKLKLDYFSGLSIQELAVKYDIDPERLNNYIANHNWRSEKNKLREEIFKESLEIFKNNIESYANELFGDMMLKWRQVFNNHYESYMNSNRLNVKYLHVKLMMVSFRSMLDAYKVFSGYTSTVNNNNTLIQINTIPEANDW